jgi:OPA family glycerol-3-phosphate transporter-like MFS transporter
MNNDADPNDPHGRDTSEEFRREHPETFARYLARRKVVFAVAYVGYVCAPSSKTCSRSKGKPFDRSQR